MSADLKWTPGPWIIGDAPEIDLEDDGKPHCVSIWTGEHGFSAEIAGRICEPANAALIAAAPDMVEALQAIQDLMHTARSAEKPRILAICASALTKARVETSR